MLKVSGTARFKCTRAGKRYLDGADNELIAEPQPENQLKSQYNLDYLITPNQHPEFCGSRATFLEYQPVNDSFALVLGLEDEPDQTYTLGWEWAIKPTMINEAWVSIASNENWNIYGSQNPGTANGYDRSTSGFDSPYIFTVSTQYKGIPGDLGTNKIPTGCLSTVTSINGTSYPSYSSGIIYNLIDSLTYVWGNHTLKFGLFLDKFGENNENQINVHTVPSGISNQNGNFNFSDTHSVLGPTTNIDLANEMLGLSDSYGEIGEQAYTDGRAWSWAEFAQDNWQMTPKLHVNYGLRISTLILPTPQWGNDAFFNPPVYKTAHAPAVNPSTGAINTAVSTTLFDGMVFAGESSFPATNRVPAANPANWTNASAELASCENGPCSNLFDPSLKKGYVNTSNEIEPRIGVAYQLTPSTVLRAGTGRFTWEEIMILDDIFSGSNPPFQPSTVVSSPRDNAAGNGPFQQVDNTTYTVAGTTVSPLTVTTLDQNMKDPSRYNWNVSNTKGRRAFRYVEAQRLF